MTNRNQRLRWIAAVFVALGLLALVAWWRWPTPSNASGKAPSPELASKTKTATSSQAIPATKSEHPLQDLTLPDDPVSNSLEQACNEYYTRELLQYRKRLVPTRSADEALGQLLIDRLVESPAEFLSGKPQPLYQAAKRLWPNDIELAWLAFDDCYDRFDVCDLDSEVRHLSTVDPDNAATWIAAMGMANKRHDPAGFTSALRHAASAEIYDQRSGVVFMHVRNLLASAPKSDNCQSTQMMLLLKEQIGRTPTEEDRVEIEARVYEPLPALAGLQGCKNPDLATTKSERADCIALLSRVERGDSLIEQLVATRLLILMQPTSARAGALRERYRQLRWLMTLAAPRPMPEKHFLRIYSDGEVATLQSIAMERHQWPPPAGWLPDNPLDRALITGEDPPDPAAPGHP